MQTAAIMGTGLIGASVGLALRANGWQTRGWDPDENALTKAESMGAVEAGADPHLTTVGADLIVLAGPLSANREALSELDTKALVTDVTSVKRPMMGIARPGVRFVGSHPMAGREHAGPSAAGPALFRGAAWVICDDGAAHPDIEAMTILVSELGAHPVVMSAAAHDRAVAETSHLPHLLAVGLTNLVGADPVSADLVAGSFRDLTRVAGADTGWWPEVLAANADEVTRALQELVERAQEIGRDAEAGDLGSIADTFENARAQRQSMSLPLTRLPVILQDRPGELARVGHALEASGVDVRDLQLRHAEHGGGGILTITVRPDEAGRLTQALQGEGFEMT